jgi:hypothetical protein
MVHQREGTKREKKKKASAICLKQRLEDGDKGLPKT